MITQLLFIILSFVSQAEDKELVLPEFDSSVRAQAGSAPEPKCTWRNSPCKGKVKTNPNAPDRSNFAPYSMDSDDKERMEHLDNKMFPTQPAKQ